MYSVDEALFYSRFHAPIMSLAKPKSKQLPFFRQFPTVSLFRNMCEETSFMHLSNLFKNLKMYLLCTLGKDSLVVLAIVWFDSLMR